MGIGATDRWSRASLTAGLILFSALLVLSIGCATTTTVTRASILKFNSNQPAYQRVAGAGNRVAQAMGTEQSGFKYGILDADSMNAMVDQKQRGIFVTAGLLHNLGQSELLCVLAHEWAHITLGHYGKRQDAASTMDALTTLVSAVHPAAMLASALINPVTKSGFSRLQEREADSRAAETLHDRLKISPYACVSAFQKLADYTERTGGREGGGLLDSHPSFTARIERLKESWPDAPKAYYVEQITVGSPAEALLVSQRLRAGEQFSGLASTFSTDPLFKLNRGEYGRYEEWELNPEVAEALKRREGANIVLFRSPAGFHIARLAEIKVPGDQGRDNEELKGGGNSGQ